MKYVVILFALFLVAASYMSFNSESEDPAILIPSETNNIEQSSASISLEEKSAKNILRPAKIPQSHSDIADKSKNIEGVGKDSTNELIGVYDDTAVAPEDESLQNFDDEVMLAEASTNIAPESGSELMSAGDDIPMSSEPIKKDMNPEKK